MNSQHNEGFCQECEAKLIIRTEHQSGGNIPPGGFTETFIECPNGCEQPESEVL